MNRQILVTALASACLALFAAGAAAQTPSNDSSAKSASPQATSTPQDQSSTQAQSSTQQGQTKASSKHAKTTKSSHHAAKSSTAKTKTTSTHHATKTKPAHSSSKANTSAEMPMTPDESAYRQALRGCVAQTDPSRRDSCIDAAIQKYGRNA